MSRWDFDKYIPMKKKKMIDREKFLAQFVECDECGYRNKKVFFEKTGKCNGCGKILDPRIYMKYFLCKKNRKI